jgi:hypothetical protein
MLRATEAVVAGAASLVDGAVVIHVAQTTRLHITYSSLDDSEA